MNRQEKSLVIEQLKSEFDHSQASFLVSFKGLSVAQMQALRKKLREKGGTLKVAKARLMRRAVEGVPGLQDMSPFFKEQVGLVFAQEKFTDIAKILADFAKENAALHLVAGCVEDSVINREKVIQIAALPSREMLLAQLCAVMQFPLIELARAMAELEKMKSAVPAE